MTYDYLGRIELLLTKYSVCCAILLYFLQVNMRSTCTGALCFFNFILILLIYTLVSLLASTLVAGRITRVAINKIRPSLFRPN